MSDSLQSTNPARPDDVVGEFPVADAAAVAAAVGRARAAFPAWRDLGLDGRSEVIRRFQQACAERKDELARLIVRESGKAIWEARAEAGLVPAKVDVSLGAGMKLVADQSVGGGARATYFPRGVLAVFGPFNFPAHLPNGHIVPALACGNTVVFKPSDQTPAVGEWMLARWREAGLPDGVLEVVHGAAETGQALAGYAGVDGVLFTGSYGTGRAIREATLDQPSKILALEMGGKNAIVVLADADVELAVAETALSIAASTGQRCTCASRLFVEAPLADEFTERLADTLGGLRVGDPRDEHTFMGPLISQASFDRVEKVRATAREAGGERIDFRVDLPAPFVGPALVRFDTLRQSHPYQRDELFAPEAALYPVDDLDQAIDAVNDSDFGLAAAVFTRDRERYEHSVGRIRTGILNWNKGTIGASGKLPFGGIGKSGNDRPAGVTASLYCTVPQAHLENEAELDPTSLPPGFPKP
ncbi:MAG: aldehyde dehydrogenase family protein [Deltaproteobacteria bacterium]|nr:aldehyde dehydrogenase family protein [Deltaproteobacteria bacterium]MBW2447557.1 aldehyde dehydrogenase family protein [Deltaproteobacteria bacterium]